MAKGGRTPTNDPTLINTAERRTLVFELRKAGMTYRQIAEAVRNQLGSDVLPKGWDERYAYKDVKRVTDRLARHLALQAEELRELELARLDEMQSGLWACARSGDVKAVGAIIRIMQRRARLQGLDQDRLDVDLTSAGEKIEVKIIGGVSLADI